MVGQTLGHYQIIEKLGEGGMGAVYKARDLKLGRTVAIKLLPASVAAHRDRLERLLQEARAASSLNHPNIVTIHEIGEADGAVFVVMEYVAGKTLQGLIGRKGLPAADALRYSVSIAGALDAAHRAGIVHRDLKPGNIMVSESGQVKLLDFGLAKLVAPSEEPAPSESTETRVEFERPKTEEGAILGTVAYMSPEQAQAKPVDARSDLFSFGAVLYEMLAGRPPFRGGNKVEILSAILREEPAPLADIPEELERILFRCLRKDPERRFQHASDLRVALEELKEESESGRLSRHEAAAPRRRRWPVYAVLAAAALIAACLVWLLVPRPGHRPFRKLTDDPGVSASPAISADGKLLAFASDRAGDAGLDIWVRQMAGGTLMRLTGDPGDEFFPQFSKDATEVFYYSNRSEGSIYAVPTLAGKPRLLAEGCGPASVSPKGDELIFYRPGTGLGPGPMFILSLKGGQPEAWQPEFRCAHRPIWSPDGDQILFVGLDPSVRNRWWIAPRRGGAPKPVQLTSVGYASAMGHWFQTSGGGNAVVLPQHIGDSVNLFVFPLASRFGLTRKPAPATFGTGWEVNPSVSASGDLVFTRAETAQIAWGIATSPKGQASAAKQLARAAAQPSISGDGTKLAFQRFVDGGLKEEIVVRDLEAGSETVLDVHPNPIALGASFPLISRDGSAVYYRAVGSPPATVITHHWIPSAGGAARNPALSGVGLLTSWSYDGKSMLGECRPAQFKKSQICRVEVASEKVTRLLSHETDDLLSPSSSWDDKWVAFMRRKRIGKTGIALAAVRVDGTLAPESEWVAISSGEFEDTRPRFAADGRMIYFFSTRGNQRLIVAQALDPVTMRPAGPPAIVHQWRILDGMLARVSGLYPNPTLGVSRDMIVYSTTETRSNIWHTTID